MTFTTILYFGFLALVFQFYWAVGRRRYQNLLLLLASYIFYGWWDYRFCFLILLSSLTDYTVGCLLNHYDRRIVRRILLGISLFVNLGILGFFKYYNFFATSFVVMADKIGFSVSPFTLNIVLPVGISFYTFQTMSYSIDVYRRQVKACLSLPDFLLFVSFFPQLVAGPIERAGHLLTQIQSPRCFHLEQAKDGLRQILVGFFKKLVLAGGMAPIVDTFYNQPGSATGPELMLATACFAFQIYYDFSAYSDIAIGTAHLLGFDLCRNFSYPYFSQSLSEFWHRWHISLSTWFRDYLYLPLGGNRCSRVRHLYNLLLTFLVSGLWHGASACFVLWGVVHGLLLLFDVILDKRVPGTADTPGGESLVPNFGTLVRMFRTFALVCFAWVFFRGGTLSNTLLILFTMGRDLFSIPGYVSAWNFLRGEHGVAIVFVMIFIIIEWLQRRELHVLVIYKKNFTVRWVSYAGMIFLIGILGSTRPEEFIYFRF